LTVQSTSGLLIQRQHSLETIGLLQPRP
jgi:hypothetical protein